MKRLSLFWLLSATILLWWCFGTQDNAPSQTINSWEIIITTWDTVMSGWVDTWTVNTDIQNTKDIVWTTIPKGEDIERFLSYYLSEEWLTGKVIGKKLARKDIITVSMWDKSVNWKCADYMSTECINFIIKNNIIIWSNSKPFIDSKKKCEQELKTIWSCVWYPWDGEVYRFTDKWVLFRFSWGEWAACQWWWADRFTYVNFDDMKTFYSALSWQDTWISPDPQDDMCENKNTKRTKTEILRFYKSNNDWNDEKKALPITAKTTEEAFYKYYNIPQSKD